MLSLLLVFADLHPLFELLLSLLHLLLADLLLAHRVLSLVCLVGL